MAKFRPLHDRLLVQRLDEEDKTRGGIIIPDTAKEKPQQGRVLAVGPGRRDDKGDVIPMDVRTGDKVMFAKYAGTEIKIDGEDRIILREEDILAIVD
jgi:chaperonin GroES